MLHTNQNHLKKLSKENTENPDENIFDEYELMMNILIHNPRSQKIVNDNSMVKSATKCNKIDKFS